MPADLLLGSPQQTDLVGPSLTHCAGHPCPPHATISQQYRQVSGTTGIPGAHSELASAAPEDLQGCEELDGLRV